MRRRDPIPERTVGSRPFTPAEVAELAELTAVPARHLDPDSDARQRRMDEIHAAAGRRRRFRLWPMDPQDHDPARALAEELNNDFDTDLPTSTTTMKGTK